jgi:hypothetical protein
MGFLISPAEEYLCVEKASLTFCNLFSCMVLNRFLADQWVKKQQSSLPFQALLEPFKSIIPLDKVQGTRLSCR